MRRTWITLCAAIALGITSQIRAADEPAAAAAPAAPAAVSPEDAKKEADYTAMIDKRADDIVVLLKIEDAAKKQKVHGIIVAQYRALRDWQTANEAKLKDKSLSADDKAAIIATRKPQHESFLSQLATELTPEQVETVKDKMTYFKVKVTYDAYVKFVPQMTDEQKAKVLGYLKEAREEAMDGVSSQEKDAIFGKYKGRINNYLSKEGIDMKKQEKAYTEAQKGNKPTTQPAAK